jgi:hypothetical protein
MRIAANLVQHLLECGWFADRVALGKVHPELSDQRFGFFVLKMS